MKIMGTKFVGHDSAIFILDLEKQEVFAISTERITRIKHDGQSIEYIFEEFYKNDLDFFNNLFKGVNWVVHSFANFNNVDACMENKSYNLWKLKINSILRKTYKVKYIKDFKKLKKDYKIKKLIKILAHSSIKNNFEILKWVVYSFVAKFSPYKNKQLFLNFIKETIQKYSIQSKIDFKDHHLSHAASAYYFSPFNCKEALVFVLDGQGDGKYQSLFRFQKNNYYLLSHSDVYMTNGFFTPYSIGHIYSAFTKVLGFTPNSDEGKTEALAAYGEPNKDLYDLLNKGYKINKEKLRWEHDIKILEKLHNEDYLKNWKEKIGDKNFAATIQRWLEDTVVEYLNIAYEKYKIPRLAMAGGVVANVIMNLNIFERTPFEEIYIFPAMGDDGTAAGAAILKAIELGYDVSWLKDLEMPYWGPSYSKEDVEKELKKDKWKNKIIYKYVGEKWPEMAAEMIANGNIVAIYQGKMEFGPRALGNRSILADPRDPKTRDKINSTVKGRPWFQPFCPSVLEEERERLFERSYKHKHMAIAFRLKKEFWDKLPSAMHIDGTARPQFVEEKDNPNYYRLIKKFKEITGYGIVVNTSFNLHGRTIVRTPEDALIDFVDCNIDALFIEGYLVKRNKGVCHVTKA